MPLSASQLSQVRRMIGEPTDVNGYTDTLLQTMSEAYLTDGEYNLRAMAASVWEEKATKVADMVDVSESGSSRKMSDVFSHYMEMAKRYQSNGSVESGATAAPRSTRIVRPSRA